MCMGEVSEVDMGEVGMYWGSSTLGIGINICVKLFTKVLLPFLVQGWDSVTECIYIHYL